MHRVTTPHLMSIRTLLRSGPVPAKELMAALDVSQPTVSRLLLALDGEVVRIGAARSIQYALRDPERRHLHAPVYRVSVDGALEHMGMLVPVCPEGFVMVEHGGKGLHTNGLPWWIADMRPQGYLGRAYNQRHGPNLRLPERLQDWSDAHVLQALIHQGGDLPGNVLIGDVAYEQFLNTPDPVPVEPADKARTYAELALAAARGDLNGSSAGGEQPKFTAFVRVAPGAAAHVIVKFSAEVDNQISQRWRDILLAEHLALNTLAEGGIAAAPSSIVDHGGRRYLEVERFDRKGARGREALYSLATLDAQFVGSGGRWPEIARGLVKARVITQHAAAHAQALWAFGALIGNTDMHSGNLSFISEGGCPYEVAPAYDMTPMVFAPAAGGDLPERQLDLKVDSQVSPAAWKTALPLAQRYVRKLQQDARFSASFESCIALLEQHVMLAAKRIGRLAGR